MYLVKNFLQRCNNSKEQQQIIFRRGKKMKIPIFFTILIKFVLPTHNSNRVFSIYSPTWIIAWELERLT